MESRSQITIGQKCVIVEDPTSEVYVCRGVDPISGRVWLCVEDAQYEGYDGDIILSPVTDMKFHVAMRDARSAFRASVHLECR